MNARDFCRAVMILLAITALAGCGKDPSTFIASAKSYMAKSDYNAAVIQLKSALQQAPNSGEARFLLAKSLLEAGDPEGAETEARKAIDLGYPPDEAYPLLARTLFLQGEFRKLVLEFGSRKLGSPEATADMETTMALAYMALKEPKNARVANDAALAASPKNPRALSVLAQLDAVANDWPAANQHIDAALAEAPNDTEALVIKAQLELSQGRRDEAIKILERAVAASPDSLKVRFTLVPLLVTSGQLDEAVAQLDALKKLSPQGFVTLYSEALVSFARGDAVHARDVNQKVLGMRPDHLPSLYLSGLINLELKSYAAAEDALQKVVARSPNDAGARRALAVTYLRTGRPQLALETLGPALGRTPDDPAMLRTLGEVYLATGNAIKAAEAYERADAIDKGSVASKVRLAQVRYAAGDTERAFTDLESLSKADSAQYQADLALITAHLRRREFDQALTAVKRLEQKQPDNPLTYNIKGTVYVGMRDLPAARAAFEKALQLQPSNFLAARSLGLIDLQQRKPEDARRRYEQMLAKDPKDEQVLLALAELLVLTRQGSSEVKAAIDRAIAAAPTSVRPRLALITFYRQLPDPKAALAAAQSAQSAFPNDLQVLEALGATQLAAGEANRALDTFKRLAELQPQAPGPLLNVAAAQFALKDYNATIDTLRRVLVIQPEQQQAWVALAQTYVVSGRPENAVAEARKLQKETPDSALGFAMEGEVLATQKKWPEAAAAYGTALVKQPLPILAIRRYVALQNAGKQGEATAMATKWMQEHPKDPTFQMYLGEQSLRKKDYRAAAASFQEALDREPDNAVILNNLAWSLTELGDPKAVPIGERAYVQAPYSPNVMDTLGWALVQTGDAKRGQELVHAASNLAPADSEIRLHLAKAMLKTGDKAGARHELETLAKLDQASPIRAEAEKLLAGL